MSSVETLPQLARDNSRWWLENGLSLERRVMPDVSVVIPVKNSQRTIRATVVVLLAQDYAAQAEVIVVGDVGDQRFGRFSASRGSAAGPV